MANIRHNRPNAIRNFILAGREGVREAGHWEWETKPCKVALSSRVFADWLQNSADAGQKEPGKQVVCFTTQSGP